MIQISIPLIPGDDGALLIPADHVTDLLRRIAADWLETTGAGDTDGDKPTVRDLAGVMAEVADQIDVECIGFASAPHP